MSNGAKEHITKMVSSSIELQSQLQKAELDAEKTTSVIRLVVFLTLAVVIFLAADERGSAAGAAIAVFLYGAGTAVGLFFAWRQFHHPVIPYLFVTFDVILVALQVLALADLMGMPAANIFALPATALIFIIMIHASMRYHPWLVVYAAALFIVAIESGLFVQGAAPSLHAADHRNGMLGTPHVGMSGLLVFQVLPSVLIVLAAFILFVKGRRTRKLLLSSIEHATRTARLSRYCR